MPRVSVVIPTYNRRALVIEALQSVFSQTVHDIETIVIDDGSCDGTEQALRAFADRVRYFYKPNGGVSSARNEGIRRATGSLIAFLDSDDLWETNFLEVTVGYLEKNPDAAMVCTGWRTLPSGHRWPALKAPLLHGHLLPRLLQTRIVRTSAVVARKTALLNAGLFDEKLEVAEDLDMWLKLAELYPIAFLNIHLSWGRRHDNRLSKNRRRHLERQLQVLEAHYRSSVTAKTAFDRRRAELYVELGQTYSKTGDYSMAKTCYKQALTFTPFSLRARRHLVRTLFARHSQSRRS